MRSQGKCAQRVFAQARSRQALLTGADRGSLGPPGQPPGPIRLRARVAAVPAGGSVRARMEPPPRRARTPPIKTLLFGLGAALVKRALSRGNCQAGRSLERSSKAQVLLRKCVLRNETESPAEERKKGKRKKRAYVCYSFIQSHAICQSSFTSLGASGKAAQKQSLLLERTRLVLLCHLEKA